MSPNDRKLGGRPPIAENLRLLKDRKGCRWRDIAEALDVQERTIVRYAKIDGGAEPSWPNVVQLAEFFGLDDPGLLYCRPDLIGRDA